VGWRRQRGTVANEKGPRPAIQYSPKMAAHHKLQAASTLQGQQTNRRPLGQRRDALNQSRPAYVVLQPTCVTISAWLVCERQYKSGRAEAEVGGAVYLEAGLFFRTCAAHVRLTQRAHCRPRGQWKTMWREKGGSRTVQVCSSLRRVGRSLTSVLLQGLFVNMSSISQTDAFTLQSHLC